MLNRRVKSRFLLGTVTVGVTSSFSVSANAGGTIASRNSSNSQFLNWGRSILSSKYFDVPVILILLVLYFYIREQSSSGGSSKIVLKESEQEAQERNDAINKIFYEGNVLPILKNIRESETKEELLALRKKFQRLERYEGVNHWGFSLWSLIFSPDEALYEEDQERWRHAHKKAIASIRRLIKEDFSVWAEMCAANFYSMKEEKEENVAALIGKFVNRMKSLQEEGSLRVEGNFDWDDEKISISEKLRFVSEVRAGGLQKLAEWTWETWFVAHPIVGSEEKQGENYIVYKYNRVKNRKFINLLIKKYEEISGWISGSKEEIIDYFGDIKELEKKRKFAKNENKFFSAKWLKKEKNKVVNDLSLGNKGISAII